jgi:hypothetical protein
MKQCEKYRQLMWLKHYDELNKDQESELKNHLHDCPDCVLDLEEISQTKMLLDKKIQLKPTASFLDQNRTELHQRLLLATQSKYRSSWQKKMWAILSLEFSPVLRFSTAVAMLLIGLLFGNLLFKAETVEEDFAQQQFSVLSETNVTGVESINYDPDTRQVVMKLNTMKQLIIQGDMERPEMKQLLVQTLINEERPNIRLKTVGALSLTKSYDQQIINALVEVLENDENPGIRLKAVRLLKQIPINSSIKNLMTNVLIHVLLKEENSAIRNEAIDGLDKLKNGSHDPIIFNAARNDTSEYVRSQAAIMLQRTENPDVPK